ncbi:MAG TPA: hypothetical protein VJ904_07460, partial [Tichowtungia sp.]|nr:hypothetical protein [Tichowtungia sp.]
MKRKPPAKKVKNRVAVTKDVTAPKQRPGIPVFNLLVTTLVWLTVIVLFYSGRLIQPQGLALGQQSPETIVASVDFTAQNISETEIRQRERAEEILPVFTIEHDELDNATQALDKLLPRVRSLLDTSDPERHALIRDLVADRLDQLSIALTPEDLLRIIPDEDTDLKAVILSAIKDPIENGIITDADLKG